MLKTKNLLMVVTFVFAIGCAVLSKETKERKLASVENPQCELPCTNNTVCMNTFIDKGAACVAIPQKPTQVFSLPFDSETKVVCTHSSGSGSHSGVNAFYALDLATDYNKPASIIRAAADGVAYVFLGEDGNLCPEPSGTPAKSESSSCGLSWGNHIRILHSDGYISFYVHLDHPLVKSEVFVRKGDPIGVEGMTGAAGHRHLHWSIQKLPGNSQKDWEDRISWDGESVPFSFEATQNGKIKIFETESIACAHAGIGYSNPSEQPRFKGVK